MATLLTTGFESDAHLSTPSAFTNALGTLIVLDKPTFSPAPVVTGNRSFGTNDNGNSSFYNGNVALGDQVIYSEEKIASLSHAMGHFLRSSASMNQGYRTSWDVSGANARASIIVYDNGTVSTDSSAYDIPVAVGDVLKMESSVIGNVIEVRVWVSGSRPSTPTVTVTKTNYATGRIGFRKTRGDVTYAAVDNVTISDSVGGAGGPTINTHPSSQTLTAGAAASLSVSATASAGSLTYQWERSTNSGSSYADVSGATSSTYGPTTTVTGGVANNGDMFRVKVTDSNGTTTSNVATLTVNASSGVKSGLNFFRNKGNGNV